MIFGVLFLDKRELHSQIERIRLREIYSIFLSLQVKWSLVVTVD